MRLGTRSARVALVCATLTSLPLAGCSLLGGTSAEDEAQHVARALTAGKPARLVFAGADDKQAQTMWDRAVAGLGAGRPTVTVASVSEKNDGDKADARLAYAWKLAGTARRWTYRTTAHLSKDRDGHWQVQLAPTLVHPALRNGERLVRHTTFAPRADVLGAHGVRLVTARPVVRLGVDRSQVAASRATTSARRLARIVGVDPGSYAKQVAAAGPKAFVEAIVLRAADAERAQAAGAARVPGVSLVSDTLPLAPTREFARAVLGTVGPVTADIVKQSKGVYTAGDEAGLTGLEQRYDAQLRGTPGVTVRAVTSSGRSRDLFTVDPKPGKPLRTTLDRRLQAEGEKALSGVRPASALVAIRPSTGDLLAVANGEGSAGQSTATVGHYAPGSTFKTVTSLALLRAGLTPSTVVSCPPTTDVTGKRFKNYSDYPPSALGRIPLSDAFANSCNTAFINQRSKVSQGDLAQAAASLGAGVDHDLGFPAYFGSVPGSLSDAGGATGHAASMIGQGRVVMSPMAMATVAASVARGRTVVPRLLPEQQTRSNPPDRPLTGRPAATLRRLMRGVVTQGSGRFLESVPGAPVLAKTGTAEFGEKQPLQTHAWMIAVHGDLAVAVFVDVGESGSGTAGPILDRFLRAAG